MTKPLDEDTQSHIPMLRPTAGLQRPFTSAQVNARGCAHGSWLGFFPAHGLTRPESPSMGQKLLPAIISTWSDWSVRRPCPRTRRRSPRRRHGGAKGNATGAGKPWRRSSGWAKDWNKRQGRNHHTDSPAPVHCPPRRRFRGFGEREDSHRPRRTPSCYARIRWRHAHMVAPGVATARNAR